MSWRLRPCISTTKPTPHASCSKRGSYNGGSSRRGSGYAITSSAGDWAVSRNAVRLGRRGTTLARRRVQESYRIPSVRGFAQHLRGGRGLELLPEVAQGVAGETRRSRRSRGRRALQAEHRRQLAE